MAAPPYATRRDLRTALDVSETARLNPAVDRALESASRAIEGLCHRVFYPMVATRTFDWPNTQRAAPWRLWLDGNELVSLTAITSGGIAISTADVYLRPDNGPPYRYIELLRTSAATFGGGATPQRDISLTGVWSGCEINELAAGTITASLTSSITTVPISDASVIGPGSLLRIGTERVICTEAGMVNTGVTVAGSGLTATAGSVNLAVSSGAGFTAGEVVAVDTERMLVTDVTGNTLTVKRAYDGTVLAAHSAAAAVYALRSLTVSRGALGTTAASHSSGAAIYRHVYPGPIVDLCVQWAMAGRSSDGPRQTGDGGGGGLVEQVYTLYGRKYRSRAV